ncbi:MAG: hypothetical protein EXR30_06600, partial [Betaproteobacteria bacterium]|nr:hypothetical protein [Betaproteobacteria bacterium]MSQ89261.1 hypothetical protein [Betaproteobacteria bacterium]
LEPRCAHRGSSLFFGRNEDCGLRCVHHGWKYDVEGKCVDMPNVPPGAAMVLGLSLGVARESGHGGGQGDAAWAD